MALDSSPSPRHDGFLAGQMLIAMPGIGDPRFERALVLVCDHDAEHAMGLAVNRPVEGLTVPDLLERLGGPVERERGFVLHTDDYANPAATTLAVSPGVALTATRDVLEAMAGHAPAPRLARMALGYAGWGAGQLEQEIRNNVWLTCPADEALIFDHDHESKWTRALAKLGIDPKFLSSQAGRA
jgi:putative transcriptional regulator